MKQYWITDFGEIPLSGTKDDLPPMKKVCVTRYDEFTGEPYDLFSETIDWTPQWRAYHQYLTELAEQVWLAEGDVSGIKALTFTEWRDRGAP